MGCMGLIGPPGPDGLTVILLTSTLGLLSQKYFIVLSGYDWSQRRERSPRKQRAEWCSGTKG